MDKYIGSQEEVDDLKKHYVRCEGDMDRLQEFVIGFDEDRTRKLIEELISKGELEPMEAFVNEPAKKRKLRLKKATREAAAAKRMKLPDENDLVTAIQQRSKSNFDSMISALEAKYASPAAKSKKAGKKGKK